MPNFLPLIETNSHWMEKGFNAIERETGELDSDKFLEVTRSRSRESRNVREDILKHLKSFVE